jgi:hypothetical protein
VTLAWLVIWLIANLIGGDEPLKLDPVNAWTATLILAVAIDLNRPRELGRSGEKPSGSA